MASIDRVLKLHQVTSKTNAIAIKSHFWAQNGALLQVIKRHGAKWCPAIGQLEFPIQNTGNLIKDIKEFDDNIIIKDVPSSEIKSILFQTHAVNPRRPSYASYNYSNRHLVYDPQLLQRYEYIRKLLMPTAKQLANHYSNGKDAYKKVLIICWQNNLTQWKNQLAERYKIDCIEVDYQDLFQNQNLNTGPLTEHEIHILTYEKLMATHISKRTIEKFQSIICDDCERWFQGLCGPSSIDSLSNIILKILKDYHAAERELILTTGTLTLQPVQLFQICHLLRPKQFGNPLRREIDYSCNDASWMKKRYIKDNRFTRELLQVLTSTALVNLAKSTESHYKKTSKTGFSLQIRMQCPMSEETSARINQLRMRFKNINREAIHSSIQSDRLKNSYQLSQASRSEEWKYLKELRETMVLDKLPFLTRHLYYLTKELGQRTILLLQSVSTLQKLERFLSQQNVSYLVYEISCEELKRGCLSYTRFNTQPSVKLCILVRDKLVQEYRKSRHEWERELQVEMQREAERELGLQRGQLFELAIHQRVRLSNPLLQRGDMIDLPKISTARHLVIFDTQIHDFSPEKEDIVSNILDNKLYCYQQDDGELASKPTFERKVQLIRHYFTTIPLNKQQSFDRQLIQRYSNNLKAYHEEEQRLQCKESIPSLQDFTKELLQGESLRCRRKKIVSELYDIDDEFDQFEFENLKKIQEESEEEDSRPRYNTTLPQGIVQLTPYIPYSGRDIKPLSSQVGIKVVPQTDDAYQVDYFDEQPYEDQSECEGEFNLRDYLVKPLPNPPISQQLPKKQEEPPVRTQNLPVQPVQQRQEESDDSIAGICLNLQKKGAIKEEVQPDMEITFNKEDYPQRQKLTIYEPPQFIEIDDDSRPSPIAICSNQDVEQVHRRICNQSNHLPPKHQERTQQLLDVNGHKKRQKPVSGFSLYCPKVTNKPKIIAPKYMSLTVRLTPNQSSFKA